MTVSKIAVQQQHHSDLVEELLALSTPEDRLSWLMERIPLHAPLSDAERDPSRRIPGCLSGLWLKAEIQDGVCFFAAHSESDLVHGIVSFVCDLYSSRPPHEVIELGSSLAQNLKLDGLLSTTRKRALSTTVGFITRQATQFAALPCPDLSPAA